MRANEKTRRLTGLALMTAIIVVLQVVASFVKFGPFSITLALAPIIIGAALYGAGAGAWLGAVFGVVVLIACIAGWDAGGNILFTANPLLTAALCIVKGAAAGFVSGLVFRGLSRRSPIGSRHHRRYRLPGGEYRHLLCGSGRVLLRHPGGLGRRLRSDLLHHLWPYRRQFCAGAGHQSGPQHGDRPGGGGQKAVLTSQSASGRPSGRPLFC